MVNAVQNTTESMIDEWVLNRFLTSKKPVESFAYITGEQGVLLITERLTRNRVKCAVLDGESYSSMVMRKVKTTETGVDVITMQGSEYPLADQQYYKASEFVRGHVAQRLEAIELEYQEITDPVKERHKIKFLNLKKELLLGNFNQIT